MSNRKMSWNAALRDLKSDRAPRSEVREERLRSTAGLRGSPVIPLSAWRGRSGRRYIVGVHSIDAGHDAIRPFVALAAVRDAAGIADRLVVAEITDEATLGTFVLLARSVGATEIHVHHLCADSAEAAAMVEDLRPDPDSTLIAAAHARGHAIVADLHGAA